MRLFRLVAAVVGLVVAPLPALGASKDAVLNKEGCWAIDVDGDACAASMTLQGGSVFLLRAQDGKVTFGLISPGKPIPRGKAGRIESEAYGFDFKSSFGEDATALFYDGELDARALAALRLARQARVLIDGKAITSMTLEGTGFEGALDGAIACSQGQSGWWGKGVGAETAEADDPPMHKDGYWLMEASETPGACVAAAKVDDVYSFAVVVAREGMSFGVSSTRDMRRGRKGRLETDAFGFDFKPAYESKAYFYPEGDLDSQAAFALRRAKTVMVSVDGKPIIDMEFEGTGYAEVLVDLTACAAGEKGWWGEGAKAAP